MHVARITISSHHPSRLNSTHLAPFALPRLTLPISVPSPLSHLILSASSIQSSPCSFSGNTFTFSLTRALIDIRKSNPVMACCTKDREIFVHSKQLSWVELSGFFYNCTILFWSMLCLLKLFCMMHYFLYSQNIFLFVPEKRQGLDFIYHMNFLICKKYIKLVVHTFIFGISSLPLMSCELGGNGRPLSLIHLTFALRSPSSLHWNTTSLPSTWVHFIIIYYN